MTCKVKRKLVISDIHGMYDMLIALLKKVNYNPSADRLIFLGDLVDKGEKSKEVVEFVSEEVNNNGAIFVLGNHDDLFYSFLKNEWEILETWVKNSGLMTLESYVGNTFFQRYSLEDARRYILKEYGHHFELLSKAKLYYEDAYRIYVHAGINPFRLDWRGSSKNEFLLIREMFYHNPIETALPVVFGHTPTINLHGNDGIWFSKQGKTIKKIGIDGRAYKKGQLNCLVIENEKNYREEFVLYEEVIKSRIA